jgi:hypothetical protein
MLCSNSLVVIDTTATTDVSPRGPSTTFLTRQVAGRRCNGDSPDFSSFYPMFDRPYQATANLSGELFAVPDAETKPQLHVSSQATELYGMAILSYWSQRRDM